MFGWLKAIFGVVKQAAPVLSPIMEALLRQYAPAVAPIIATIGKTITASDATKRKIAAREIRKLLAKQGVKLTDSQINLLIEYVVVKLKERR